MIKLYYLPLTVTIKLINVLGGTWGRIILTLYILNRTMSLNLLLMGLYKAIMMAATITTVTWHAASTMAFVGVTAGLWEVVIAGQSLFFTMGQVAMITGVALVGFGIMVAVGKWLGDTFSPLVSIFLAVAFAIAAVWAAASWGANVSSTLKAWATLGAATIAMGLLVGGLGSFAFGQPEDMDMSGYDAQLTGNYALGNGGTSASQEALYVNKLVYTDSNVAEQMRTSAQMQKGASGEFV